MKIQSEEIQKLKPILLCITYAVLLLVVALNIGTIFHFFGTALRVLTPLWYGILLAFVLNLPMKVIERFIKKRCKENSWINKKSRGISLTLTVILVLIILTIVLSLVIPQVLDSFKMLVTNISAFVAHFSTNINTILNSLHIEGYQIDAQSITQTINSLGFSWESITASLKDWALGSGNTLLNNVLSFGGDLANWFTGFMISLYFCGSKEKFIRQLKKFIGALFPYPTAKKICAYATSVNNTFSSFFSGQLVEACILGVLCYIGMLILQFPFAPLISVVVTITAIIPMFGAMFAMLFGCLIILAAGSPITMIWFIVYFQCLQQFENNLIYPRVVGTSVGLPGVWVLLSLILFGSNFGFVGMLIAVPFTACCYNFASVIINQKLQERNLTVTTEGITLEDRLA